MYGSSPDFMGYLDKERYSSAPMAAMAAWNAMIVALHDEELLKEQYKDVTDNDLDFSDWDTAYYAYIALSGTDENWDHSQKEVQGMKFWIWNPLAGPSDGTFGNQSE